MMKRPRVKDSAHLEFIRQLPCACCGNPIETEAAHLREGALTYGKHYTGKAEKPSDRWVLPLCGFHHREQHQGSEEGFWINYRINPFVLALSLYGCSGDYATAEQVISLQRMGAAQ